MACLLLLEYTRCVGDLLSDAGSCVIHYRVCLSADNKKAGVIHAQRQLFTSAYSLTSVPDYRPALHLGSV